MMLADEGGDDDDDESEPDEFMTRFTLLEVLASLYRPFGEELFDPRYQKEIEDAEERVRQYRQEHPPIAVGTFPFICRLSPNPLMPPLADTDTTPTPPSP